MKSFYYSRSWQELNKSKDDYIYYKEYIPILSKIIKNLRKAHISLTIVDKDYSVIEEILKNPSYKNHIDIQDCPEEIKNKLEKEGFKINEWGTIIIDLDKSEEELWNNIKKETRKIIKKTINEGCSVEVCKDEKDFKEYYYLLKQSRSLLQFKTPSYHKFVPQWKIMHPNNYEVFLVKDSNNELLAGMGVVHTKEYMIEVAAARSEGSKNRHIYANDLLKWEIIKWGQKNGIKYYDLAGVNPNPELGSKDENIRKFKEKWGGQYHTWSHFERYNNKNIIHKIISYAEKKYIHIKKEI